MRWYGSDVTHTQATYVQYAGAPLFPTGPTSCNFTVQLVCCSANTAFLFSYMMWKRANRKFCCCVYLLHILSLSRHLLTNYLSVMNHRTATVGDDTVVRVWIRDSMSADAHHPGTRKRRYRAVLSSHCFQSLFPAWSLISFVLLSLCLCRVCLCVPNNLRCLGTTRSCSPRAAPTYVCRSSICVCPRTPSHLSRRLARQRCGRRRLHAYVCLSVRRAGFRRRRYCRHSGKQYLQPLAPFKWDPAVLADPAPVAASV